MSTCSQLRKKARETLGGGIFSAPWLYALLVSLIISAISGVASTLFVAVLIVAGPLGVGHAKYYILRARREIPHDSLDPAIDGFRTNAGDNIITGLLVTVFTFLWALLFIIPGIVKSYSYALTYYVRCDHPEYTPTEAITESRRLMDGYKFKLFKLHLSFIGWELLGALCFGIGMLWVEPYIQAATAEFYEEVLAAKSDIYIPSNENAESGEENL